MTLTLIIVLALVVVLALAVGVLAIVNRRMRRKHKQEREELERQYRAVDELLNTEAWKLDELWTNSQRLENELEALVRMLDEQDSRSIYSYGIGGNYCKVDEEYEEQRKKLDIKELAKRYGITEEEAKERLLREEENDLWLAKKQTTTDIYELRELRAMLARLKEINEEHREVSYNALRELKRIRREIDRISKRTEKAREDRKKEK